MATLPARLTLSGGIVGLREWREPDAPVLEEVCGEWDVSIHLGPLVVIYALHPPSP